MLLPLGYAQANFIFAGSGLPTGAECTLGIDVGEYLGTEQEAVDLIAAAWADYIMPQLSAQISLVSTRLKYGPHETGAVAISSQVEAGGDSSSGMSPNVAGLVRKQTAAGGRAGKGRLYVPGMNEADVDQSGGLASVAAADLQTAFDSFHSQLTASDLVPVVLHSTDTVWPAPTPITNFQVDGRVATQRRRLRR